jgi:hypothetical protein
MVPVECMLQYLPLLRAELPRVTVPILIMTAYHTSMQWAYHLSIDWLSGEVSGMRYILLVKRY